jgi:hypothetical protein
MNIISGATIMTLANGNMGAMNFIKKLIELEDSEIRDKIFEKIKTCTTIRGTNLCVLYSDLCCRDMNVVYMLCDCCPDAVLEDACSRQDYSGRDLVISYILPKIQTL